jgi:hypothetical protein
VIPMNETVIIALVTALTSGGTLAFIQYLISRSDNKKEKKDSTLKSVHLMLDNDNKRIKKVEDDLDYIKKTQTQTLQCLLVILDELKKNNDVDGVISKQEDDMRTFLLNRME